MLLNDVVDKYLKNLSIKTDSKETNRGYRNMLINDFIPYIEKKYNGPVYVDEIIITDIEDYLFFYRKDIKGDANVSVNRNLYIIRSLYNYMTNSDIVEKNFPQRIEPLKVNKKEKDTLSLTEMDELIGAIDHDLIRLAVRTMSLTGIRVSELCSLTLDTVNINEKMIYIVDGKSGDRKVPIAESLLPELEEYLANDRPDVDSQNFFALEKSGSLSPQYINRILGDTTRALGWTKNIKSHSIRRSTATNLVRQGANIKEVSKILGHADLKTTSIYLFSDEKELSDAVNLLG